MNERIDKLLVKAGAYFSGEGVDYSNFDPNKFAKLIVRECARVIDRGDGEMSSMAETSWCNICRDDILNHFGVKK